LAARFNKPSLKQHENGAFGVGNSLQGEKRKFCWACSKGAKEVDELNTKKPQKKGDRVVNVAVYAKGK